MLVPKSKKIQFLGTTTRQARELDQKAKEGEHAIEVKARLNWKGREEGGFGSVHSNMQRPSPPDLESIIGDRISSLCSIDMDNLGMVKKNLWMNGVVMRVSDGTWLVSANARKKCFKTGEAAEVLWDAVPEVNFLKGKSIVEFKPQLWNKDKLGAWCMDLGKIDYGIEYV